MIKSIYILTLRDIIVLFRTKKTNHLKTIKWIPFFIVKPKLEKLINEIQERIGGETVEDLENKIDQLISYRKIESLIALYKAVHVELVLNKGINLWEIIEKGEQKTKESELALKIFEEVKLRTDPPIEIKTLEDLKRFENYIEHKKIKYKENYPEKEIEENEGNEVDYVEIIYGYFRYMGEKYDENMNFLSFLAFKKIASSLMEKKKLDGED